MPLHVCVFPYILFVKCMFYYDHIDNTVLIVIFYILSVDI